MKTDLIQAFLQLPAFVTVGGHEFCPALIHDVNELRLVYRFAKDELESWDNTYITDIEGNPHACNFLWLREGIETESDLDEAIWDCSAFLQEHGLMPKE